MLRQHLMEQIIESKGIWVIKTAKRVGSGGTVLLVVVGVVIVSELERSPLDDGGLVELHKRRRRSRQLNLIREGGGGGGGGGGNSGTARRIGVTRHQYGIGLTVHILTFGILCLAGRSGPTTSSALPEMSAIGAALAEMLAERLDQRSVEKLAAVVPFFMAEENATFFDRHREQLGGSQEVLGRVVLVLVLVVGVPGAVGGRGRVVVNQLILLVEVEQHGGGLNEEEARLTLSHFSRLKTAAQKSTLENATRYWWYFRKHVVWMERSRRKRWRLTQRGRYGPNGSPTQNGRFYSVGNSSAHGK